MVGFPKSGHKIQAGPILEEKPSKTDPWTTFVAKTGPAGLILAAKMVPSCQNQFPIGDCQNWFSHRVAFLFLHVHGYMDATII